MPLPTAHDWRTWRRCQDDWNGWEWVGLGVCAQSVHGLGYGVSCEGKQARRTRTEGHSLEKRVGKRASVESNCCVLQLSQSSSRKASDRRPTHPSSLRKPFSTSASSGRPSLSVHHHLSFSQLVFHTIVSHKNASTRERRLRLHADPHPLPLSLHDHPRCSESRFLPVFIAQP